VNVQRLKCEPQSPLSEEISVEIKALEQLGRDEITQGKEEGCDIIEIEKRYLKALGWFIILFHLIAKLMIHFGFGIDCSTG